MVSETESIKLSTLTCGKTEEAFHSLFKRPSLNSLNTLLKRVASPRMSNLACVSGAFSEFLKVWSSGGSASLQLNSSNGGCDITFSAHLGHPGATFQPSPTPLPTPSYRRRTPADKVRNQKRAAAHQESLSASAPPAEARVPRLRWSIFNSHLSSTAILKIE